MTPESPPAKPSRPRAALKASGPGGPRALTLLGLDAALVLAFLALTFLLGVFPLKDTDFWWHLKAGDTIRATGAVPREDTFTYTLPPHSPWIDLHWVFQVGVSWLYERGGVPALNFAKCVITCAAVLLLITARPRGWPFWAILASWLPALLVLGGRMYVRPETLTLFYLAVFLAVLVRIDRRPWLAWILPVVEVAWVNTQGLFVFGPILLAFALADAALRPGSFAKGRAGWWRVVGVATVLTGLACFVNPYFVRGALYPLELLRTMGNPVFSGTIAELTPIPEFIKQAGFGNLSLRLHFVTMILGALSFLLPMSWVAYTRLRSPAPRPEALPAAGKVKAKDRARTRAKKGRAVEPPPPAWRLSVFRLLLFAAFSVLSLRATRNSHQFAAVVGALTAWNFGEWAAAWRRKVRERDGRVDAVKVEVVPRLAAFSAVAGVLLWVVTGGFYAATREGRTIGWGEQPLWYAHQAVKFAGGPGLPPKFLGFHIGHPSLYEYYHAPAGKVFADARLEVMGGDLYERYLGLQQAVGKGQSGWQRLLDEAGRPVILADHEGAWGVAGTLLNDASWKCVWFDPVASVFVHDAYRDVVERHGVDFAGRHFHPEPGFEPKGRDAYVASAKGLRNVAGRLVEAGGPDKARGLVLLGMGHARKALLARPDDPDAWKQLALYETLREPTLGTKVPRFQGPFDPVFDLSVVRATYAARRALAGAPGDFLSLLWLDRLYEDRAMTEEAVGALEEIANASTINPHQVEQQEVARGRLPGLRASLGPAPPTAWRNLSELGRIVNGLYAQGRVATAADYLERAQPPKSRSWDDADRIATLRLHLGEPGRARGLWQAAPAPPAAGLREARVAACRLAEGDFGAARASYRAAVRANPGLFEAWYGLAVLEQDDGHAPEALDAARKAEAVAPGEVARSAARSVAAVVSPYAVPRVASP